MESLQILHCFFIAIVLLSGACLVTCDEEEVENEFSYVEGSKNGPDNWGDIHPKWRMCKTGKMQSPIDLLDKRVQLAADLGKLKLSYTPSNATLINRGHDIMLKWQGDAGFLEINGSQYKLEQCHWHSPSEHTINGWRLDLEMHLVHKSPSGENAVIGILYNIGQPDPLLSKLKANIKALTDTRGIEGAIGIINPNQIQISGRECYTYIGSLTVPPCTENVPWTIIQKGGTVSREQVKLIREAVHDESEKNARPTQPINNRSVKFYRPKVQEKGI